MTLISVFLLSLIALANAGLVPRIIGGTVAKSGEIPYQVSLQQKTQRSHFCGGSILNTRYVITAAHCVKGKTPEAVLVVAGTVDLLKKGSEHNCEKFYIHEKYNSTDSWINDIALIKVKTPFVKSALVSFVPLPNAQQVVKTNATAIVSGFGRLAYAGNRTNLLYWVDIQIADQTYCKQAYRGMENIYPTHVCAYDPTAVRGHCKGDSGGPLMVNGTLTGIVSWSFNCANVIYPSVYTRVSAYVDWIKKHAV